SADGARSVYTVDVDGDGDMDVLSASHLDNTVAWYENKSSSRTGDGVVKYQVAANDSAAQRTGTITVAGKTHTVVQAGAEVLAKPVISKQESQAVGQPGGSLVLAVEVSGEGLSYQWQKDGTDVAGATSATLELSGLSATKAGSYVLKVSNEGGIVTSEPIVVSVTRFVILLNGEAAGSTATEVDKVLVEIESGKTGWITYYTLDGSAPDDNGMEYEVPFELTNGATIRVIAFAPDFSDYLVGPTVDLTVLQSQTLTVEVPQGVAYGVPVTLVGSASSGLPVTYEVTEGPGKVESGSFEGTGSGVVTVKAKQVGNGTYASKEKTFLVLVNKGVQTVSWGTVTAKTYGDAAFNVSATASSGLPLTYEVVSGPATIDGESVTLTGAGTVVLKAIQAGDANLKAAEAEVSIAVAKSKQTVSFTSLYGTKAFTTAPIQLGATASSGLSVVYEVIQGQAEVFGADLTLTGVGVVTVRAKQLGNDDYEAASAVDRSVTVEQTSQTIEIEVSSPIAWQPEPIEVLIKTDSGLSDFKFEVLDGPGELGFTPQYWFDRDRYGTKLKLMGVGEITLVLSEPGDARYAAALTQKTVTVIKAEQAITFEDLAAQIGFKEAAIELKATSTSGLEVGYEVVAEHATRGVEWGLSSSEIVGGKLLLPQLGLLPQTVTVKAVQSGDSIHNAASAVEQSFELVRGEDVLSFEKIGDRLLGTAAIDLSATSSSGKSPKFSIVNGPAQIPSSTLGELHLLGTEGTVIVRASTTGNKYYLPADSTQSFEVKLKGWIALETLSGGTVELSPDQDLYEPGTVVSLTPKPDTGYAFEGWSGELSGSDNPKSVIVTAPMSVGATFKDVQGPVVSLTGPTAGATSEVGYTLSGSVSDNRGVSAANWTLGGVDQGALTLDSAGGFSVADLKLRYGSNVIVVKATDEGGNAGSGTVTVNWEPKRTLRIGTVIERQEGQKMEVPIELKSAGDVSSMTFVLKYDPKYLTEPNLVWSSEMLGVLNSVNTSTVGELRCAFSLGGT
ncbi:chitobiase/beta-hexosaminidase C-terminal domain-containing protein, partial [bacterium]|nr:chitobiase/beta-hexosaminidase C-terminal domain-containing protein [bacterium]